ncbi:hypothetical protein [Streptomyces sulphureus]|uniref:hypothetical protein n=1 Tax=Streptomyces sulphureus TaxID=47758 RepID=UPI0003711540|nr:hypothetical protein [Streptomyces sulphureus]
MAEEDPTDSGHGEFEPLRQGGEAGGLGVGEEGGGPPVGRRGRAGGRRRAVREEFALGVARKDAGAVAERVEETEGPAGEPPPGRR